MNLKAKVILLSVLAAITILFFIRTANADDMFTPPNAQAKIITKYFNRGQSFEFCWERYDIVSKRYLRDKMCIFKDGRVQNITFNFGRSIAKVGAPEIVVRYNTLDRGLVDKTYPVAVDNKSGGAIILNPEDKSDIVNMLINSRDIIVFYKVDGDTDYLMAYYPLPIRDEAGNVKTQEVR